MRRLQLAIAACACLGGTHAYAGESQRDAAVEPAAKAVSATEAPSVFDGYRRFDPYPDTIDWRTANDEVGRLGGFAGHLGDSVRDGEHAGGEGGR